MPRINPRRSGLRPYLHDTRSTSSWRLQTLNPCRACTKPICNVSTKEEKTRYIWNDLSRSCFLLLMLQGCSHVCPYWANGYCAYEGKNACFFLEEKKGTDPKRMRPWMKYRFEVASFLSKLSWGPSGHPPQSPPGGIPGAIPSGEGQGSSPLPNSLSSPPKSLCPFLIFSDPKRTVFPASPSSLEAYKNGYLPTSVEGLLGISGRLLRRKFIGKILKFVEEEEAYLNGMRKEPAVWEMDLPVSTS